MFATASRSVALPSGSCTVIRIERSCATVAVEGVSLQARKSRAHLPPLTSQARLRPLLASSSERFSCELASSSLNLARRTYASKIIKPKDFGAGSIDLLDSLDPEPPRLTAHSLGYPLSETCLFFTTGPGDRSFAVLSALEVEGIQTKGVIAVPAKAGVYVDFLSNQDLQRVLELSDFQFRSKRTSRQLLYPTEAPPPDIFAAAAASRAASLPAPYPAPTPTPTPTPTPEPKPSPMASPTPPKSPKPSYNKGPPLHLKPSSSQPKTPAKPPLPTRPSAKEERAFVPSPAAKAKAAIVEHKAREEKKTKSRPINPIESHSVTPERVRDLFKETAGVGIGKVHTGKELFEEEDGVLFARVEIPGFPHKVYISTSLADPAP